MHPRHVQGEFNLSERLQTLLDNQTLSLRERPFISSLKGAFDRFGGLTPAQFSAFEKVEARYDSDKMDEFAEWEAVYKAEKREIAILAANYYKETPYFANLVKRLLNNKDFVPTMSEYNNLCENKYFKKVYDTYNSEPEFKNGDLVAIRCAKGFAKDAILMILAHQKDKLDIYPRYEVSCITKNKFYLNGTLVNYLTTISVRENQIKRVSRKKAKE